jgi:hypothetical protein
VAAAKTLSVLRQTLKSLLLRTLIEEKKTSPLSRKPSQDTELKKKQMSSAKFYIKHPIEKRRPPPQKKTTTNPYQTNLAQKSCKPLPLPFPVASNFRS